MEKRQFPHCTTKVQILMMAENSEPWQDIANLSHPYVFVEAWSMVNPLGEMRLASNLVAKSAKKKHLEKQLRHYSIYHQSWSFMIFWRVTRWRAQLGERSTNVSIRISAACGVNEGGTHGKKKTHCGPGAFFWRPFFKSQGGWACDRWKTDSTTWTNLCSMMLFYLMHL